MFDTFSYEGIVNQVKLYDRMLIDRAQQFVMRHRWDLKTDAKGREIDNFDCSGTTYCVVHDSDSHNASLRLRSNADDCMAALLCADAWRENQSALAGSLEVTRLCASPSIGAAQGSLVTVELLRGLCQFGIRNDRTRLFGLVFPSVARSIKLAGWPSETLASFKLDDRTVLLALWECSHSVDWALQERQSQLERIAPAAPAHSKAA